jgi:AraC-like DNA-binding protein
MPVSASQSVQRVGPLAQLPAVLAEHGVRLEAILDGLPVRGEDLKPELFLPISVISAILDRVAAHEGLAAIGLILLRAQNHAVLGPLGQLMASCETLGSALGTYASVQMANSTAAAVYLHPVGDDYALGFGVYSPELPTSHIYDAAAATACNVVHDLTGGAVRPQEVLLSRPVPPDPDVYTRYFRCPVRFNEGQTCLILRARDMAFRLPSANARLREGLLASLQRQMAQQPPGFAPRVKHALRPLLLAGRASHRDVAAHLNMHPRTMGRRLELESVTFEQLKDEVRLAVSRELLARTDIAVSDVAAALGYATPSAFVRAFRRWTGRSPSAWRKESRTAGV